MMRQNIKKLTALLLAAAMVLCMDFSAYAAEPMSSEDGEEILVDESIISEESIEEECELESEDGFSEEEILEEELVENGTDDEYELTGEPSGTPFDLVITNPDLRDYFKTTTYEYWDISSGGGRDKKT